jgi:hypothetical protein
MADSSSKWASVVGGRLFQPVNLVSLPAGELLIFLHLRSFYLVV